MVNAPPEGSRRSWDDFLGAVEACPIPREAIFDMSWEVCTVVLGKWAKREDRVAKDAVDFVWRENG